MTEKHRHKYNSLFGIQGPNDTFQDPDLTEVVAICECNRKIWIYDTEERLRKRFDLPKEAA